MALRQTLDGLLASDLPFATKKTGVFQPLFGWVGARRLYDEAVLVVEQRGRVDDRLEDQAQRLRDMGLLWPGEVFDQLRGEPPLPFDFGTQHRRWRQPLEPRDLAVSTDPANAARVVTANLLQLAGEYSAAEVAAEETGEALSTETRLAFLQTLGEVEVTLRRVMSLDSADRVAIARPRDRVRKLDLGAGEEREDGSSGARVPPLTGDPLVRPDDPTAALFLSPLGILHLYQEDYFHLGAPPVREVGYMLLHPRSKRVSTESVSTSNYEMLESELQIQRETEQESTTTETESFAERIQEERQSDTSFGASASGGVDLEVWNAGGSANFDYATGQAETIELSTEKTRQTSNTVREKIMVRQRHLSRQERRVETGMTSRIEVDNPLAEPIQYALYRRYDKIGAEVRPLGTYLCWRSIVRHPHTLLDTPALVHVGASMDYLTMVQEETPVVAGEPMTKARDLIVHWAPRPGRDPDRDEDYGQFNTVLSGDGATYLRRVNGDQSEMIRRTHTSDFYPPKLGYKLASARQAGAAVGLTPGKDPVKIFDFTLKTSGPNDAGVFTVTLTLNHANFEENMSVKVPLELYWEPPGEEFYADPDADQRREEELARRAREEIVESVRERTELARSVTRRPSVDLRREEQSAVRSALFEQLHEAANVFTGGVADVVRDTYIDALFSLDDIIYFLAPDWWRPRPTTAFMGTPTVTSPAGDFGFDPATYAFRYGREDVGEQNLGYLITESSRAAPYGSSLGWTVQLDGDDRRNAFLNAPYVMAAIPVRAGREEEALQLVIELEGDYGLDRELFVDGVSTGNVLTRITELVGAIRAQELTRRDPGSMILPTSDGFHILDQPGAVRHDPSTALDGADATPAVEGAPTPDDTNSETTDTTATNGATTVPLRKDFTVLVPTDRVMAVAERPYPQSPPDAD